jgi:hypothetical protein
VSDSEKSRKHELECLRLASACMQLACDVPNPALQSHFVRMARVWQIQVEHGPSADIETENSIKRAYSAHAQFSRRLRPALRH